MAVKLPSDISFGARPAAQGSGVVPSYRPSQENMADMESGAATAKFGEQIAGVAEKFAGAGARIQARQDAVERARAYGDFSESVEGELRRLSTESDFSRLDTVQGFGNFVKQKQDDILAKHPGTDDSKLVLSEKLEAARGIYASKAAQLSFDAGEKVVNDMLGAKINTIVAKSWNSPGNIADHFRAVDAEIDDMAPALGPDKERQARLVWRERVAEAAVGSMIGKGAFGEAEKLMNLPGLSEVLGPQAQTRVNNQLLAAKQVVANAQMAGQMKRSELASYLGREPSQAELMQYVGMGPKSDNTTEEVGDATSPTGTRVIPRSMVMAGNITPEKLAMYPPGKPPSGGINIDMDPETGKVRSISTGRPSDQTKPGAVPGMGTEGGNIVDKDLLAAMQTRQSLTSMAARFKPEYQQIPTRLGIEGTALKEKANVGKVSDADKVQLDDYVQYRADVGQNFSNTLKQLSGVAVNPTELKRAEIYLPNAGAGIADGDSPTELVGKIKRFSDFNDKVIARLAYTKAKGVKFDTVNLEEMPTIIKSRAAEIEKQLAGQNVSGDALKAGIRNQISREFGFAN